MIDRGRADWDLLRELARGRATDTAFAASGYTTFERDLARARAEAERRDDRALGQRPSRTTTRPTGTADIDGDTARRQ